LRRLVLFLLLFTAILACTGPAPLYAANSSHLVAVGPLADYRSSEAVDYATLHLLGPLFKAERKQTEHETAFRPLFYRSSDPARGAALVDVLFPLYRYRRDRDMVEWNLLSILRYESQDYPERQRREYSLFPLFEYGHGDGRPTSYAFFPLAAHVYNWFGREETEYLLFPLWSRTRHRDGTRVDNVLWPFFARIHGDDPQEHGFKIWPVVGSASRPGHYDKFFLLWPFWISNDTRLDSDAPRHDRYAFPFWLYTETPRRSERTVLWPLFSWVEQRGDQPYSVINAPWPLVLIAKGEYRHGLNILPFYGDVTTGTSRTRWYLWPLYRQQTSTLDTVIRTRQSLFYLLYTDLEEQVKGDRTIRSHRRLLWPLFGYYYKDGVSRFYTPALVEPFFPESEGVERNWSPFWRIYQTRWDQAGNRVSSLLWNLYWRETGPTGTAWEFFPLVSYWNEPKVKLEWTLLKGLVRYQRSKEEGRRLHLLYLPWGIPLGDSAAPD